jgi:hypothetical protein
MHAPSRHALVIAVVLGAATLAVAPPAAAAKAGDIVQTDNIGVPLYTANFNNSSKSFGITDKLLISEFMGGSYFLTDTIRVGLMFQFTEQFSGDVPVGSDHFSTFALLPQIGWNFYDHFSAAAIFTYAARAAGKDAYDLGIQGLIGYTLPINDRAGFNMLLEIPYNFHLAETLGVTPLLGFNYTL